MIVTYNSDGKITGSILASLESIDTAGLRYIVLEDTQSLENKKVVDGELVSKDDSVIEAELKAKTMLEIKNRRLQLLYDCDWTQSADSPLAESKKTEWIAYRKSLRDLPASYPNETNIDNVVFPSPPAS